MKEFLTGLQRLKLITAFFRKPNGYLYSTSSSTRPSEKRIFSRSKPNCIVGTVGHVHHGKTTLTTALQKILAEMFPDLNAMPKEKKGISMQNISKVDFATDKRHYVSIDCPGHGDYIKNMLAGAAQMDGAVLVVAATEGTMPQTREHLTLVKQLGLNHIIVYINKIDEVDKEQVDLVEVETRELLNSLGLDGDKSPVIFGSALRAIENNKPELGRKSILKLIDAIDTYIPNMKRQLDKPFMMPLDGIYTVPDRGTVVTGRLERGTFKKGDDCEILGFNKHFKSVITGTETFHKILEEARAGDHVDAVLRGIKKEDIRRGMILCKPGSCNLHDNIEVKVRFLKPEEGGRNRGWNNNSNFMVFSKTWDMAASINFQDRETVEPGQDVSLNLRLQKQMVIEEMQPILLRDGSLTIGLGNVTKVLPNLTQDERDSMSSTKKKKLKRDKTFE